MSTSQDCFVANQDPERDQGVIQQVVNVHERNGVESGRAGWTAAWSDTSKSCPASASGDIQGPLRAIPYPSWLLIVVFIEIDQRHFKQLIWIYKIDYSSR